MINRKVFTEPIISYDDIESNLINIFSDSIITDTQFNVTDISPTVLKLLKYNKSDVMGKPLSLLLSEDNQNLISLLNNGYFTNTRFGLRDQTGEMVEVYLSGYFLGLISDINGKVVILIKSRKSILQEKKNIDKRIIELNDLIYRTSHDIRGPLATIKGLVNAAKCEADIANILHYLDLITKVSDRLDLVLEYLRESIRRKNYQFCSLNINELVLEMQDRIKKLSGIYDVNINFSIVRKYEEISFYTNPFLSSILIENLILIMESLKGDKNGTYNVELTSYNGFVQVKIQTAYLTQAVETYLNKEMNFKNVRELIKRSGYHYLNFRIIKICSEIIKSEIVINEEPVPSLLITIPSMTNEN